MTTTKQETFIVKARAFAFKHHEGQVDKLGKPYTEHLTAVANGVRLLGGSPEAIAAAYLHDVVEDCFKVTYGTLIDEGFPPAVVRVVWAVTKTIGEEQTQYLERIVSTGQDAMHVKLADLLHNTRHDRLAKLKEGVRKRLLKKYRPAIARLMLELGLIVTEEDQKKLATQPVNSTWSTYPVTSSSAEYLGAAYFGPSQLVKGDWVAGWPSPIQQQDEKNPRVYTLDSGEVYEVHSQGSLRAWTKTAYTYIQGIRPDWNPSKEWQVKTVKVVVRKPQEG